MQPRLRTKRAEFKKFKSKVAELVGGRYRLTCIFPNPEDRKKLYNAILFDAQIDGGQPDKDILYKYNKVILKTLFM